MMQVRLCWSQKLTTLHLSKLAAHLEHPTVLPSALEFISEVMKSSFCVTEKLLLQSSLSSIAPNHFFQRKCRINRSKFTTFIFKLLYLMFSGGCAAGVAALLLCQAWKIRKPGLSGLL